MKKKLDQIFDQRQRPEAKPFFVFEMANNHMGNVKHGLAIIRAVKEACRGFSRQGWLFGFKFQYRDLDSFIHPDYRGRMDLKYVKRFSETRLLEKNFLALKKEVEKAGFISVCTPFDEPSVDKIVAHKFDVLKIASASFSDWPLLEKIVQTDKPIIASTGGAKLEDIDKVVSFFQHRQKQFAILHCIGQYPVPPDQLQLNQITLLRERYPEITIGFSTHEAPDNFDAIKMAVAKGAGIFEKHVGIKNEQYSLNAYSATPEQVSQWLAAADQAYQMCGVAGRRHESSPVEQADIRQFQRGVFASREIKVGERVDAKDTFYAWPNQPGQYLANDMSKYAVLVAKKNIKKNAPVTANVTQKAETREEVLKAVTKVNQLLRQANVPVSTKWDFELSHHYGLDKFYEVGASIASCINREYCKKLIVLLPGQRHPLHTHKIKEETFNVVYGDVTFNLGGKPKKCQAGDIVVVERGVLHDFSSKNGCVFEEISTTHVVGDSYYQDKKIMVNKNRKTSLTYWIV